MINNIKVECFICKCELVLNKTCKNKYAATTCNICKWQHSFWMGKDMDPKLSWMGKRFSHNNTVWHSTYRPDLDETTFIVIKNKSIVEKRIQVADRIRYKLSTLILQDRFIKLLAFL